MTSPKNARAVALPSALRRYATKIESVDAGQDGWKFVYLRPGWIYDGVHQIAYGTWRECAASFCMVERCDCADCKEAAHAA